MAPLRSTSVLTATSFSIPPTSLRLTALWSHSSSPGKYLFCDGSFAGSLIFANCTASGDIPHSVTQGDFSNPCQPLQAQGSDAAGFDSGLTNSVQWTLNVTNDKIRE